MRPKLLAACTMSLVSAFYACDRGRPPPTPTPAPAVTAAAATIDSAQASAQPAPVPATDGKDAGVIDASRTPSLRLLRDLAEGREDVRGVVDPEQGVAFVVVGPTYNPDTGKTEHVKSAEKWCGRKVASDVQRELRVALVNVHSDDQMVCKDLACVHEASGEWDGYVRLELARKNGRLIIVAIEHVLDVPVRQDADKDVTWARRQRTALVKERCQ